MWYRDVPEPSQAKPFGRQVAVCARAAVTRPRASAGWQHPRLARTAAALQLHPQGPHGGCRGAPAPLSTKRAELVVRTDASSAAVFTLRAEAVMHAQVAPAALSLVKRLFLCSQMLVTPHSLHCERLRSCVHFALFSEVVLLRFGLAFLAGAGFPSVRTASLSSLRSPLGGGIMPGLFGGGITPKKGRLCCISAQYCISSCHTVAAVAGAATAKDAPASASSCGRGLLRPRQPPRSAGWRALDCASCRRAPSVALGQGCPTLGCPGCPMDTTHPTQHSHTHSMSHTHTRTATQPPTYTCTYTHTHSYQHTHVLTFSLSVSLSLSLLILSQTGRCLKRLVRSQQFLVGWPDTPKSPRASPR